MKSCKQFTAALAQRHRAGVMSLETVLAASVIVIACGSLMIMARQAVSRVVDAIFFLVGCPWF